MDEHQRVGDGGYSCREELRNNNCPSTTACNHQVVLSAYEQLNAATLSNIPILD